MLVMSFYSSGTRFRWSQRANGDIGHTWGIRNVFIGPACQGHCNGQGQCLIDRCKCDSGYTGSDCRIVVRQNPVS